MTWFEKLTGFTEENPEQVRDNIEIIGNRLISKVNGKEYVCGKLETPSLKELRNRSSINDYHSKIKVSEVIGDVQKFHQQDSNNGAFFQVASQFNLLEMDNPNRTPEAGVSIYEYDATQGPACAVACGAGTIYRNYFVDLKTQIGQTSDKQIDCLTDIGKELGNENEDLWSMSNGYALATKEGLINISQQLTTMPPDDYDCLKQNIRIGIQWHTQVTIGKSNNMVTQAYCSALPVSYTSVNFELWEPFARLILEASYEATLHTALENYEKTGNNRIFLTLIGGGVFGNKPEWIFDAMKKVVTKFNSTPLDIRIISFRKSKPVVRQFIESMKTVII